MSRVARFAAGFVAIGIASLSFIATPARAEDPTIKLEMKDGVITPSPLEVPAKKAFRLEIKNAGKTPAEFESKELRKEKVIAPGVTTVIVFRPLDPGEYTFFDEFHEKTSTTKLIAK